MQKILLLLGLALVFVSRTTTALGGGFSNKTYHGRYVCELHPTEGDTDKGGGVLLIFPDGKGGFAATGTLVGAHESEQDCPLSLCPGTTCGSCTLPNPSSYSVGADGLGTSIENYFRASGGSCSAVCFETPSTFLLTAKGSQTKFVYQDILQNGSGTWGDKSSVGNCIGG